jgi:hypothetical protein
MKLSDERETRCVAHGRSDILDKNVDILSIQTQILNPCKIHDEDEIEGYTMRL